MAGQRYWSSMLNDQATITCGIWTPDDQQVISQVFQFQSLLFKKNLYNKVNRVVCLNNNKCGHTLAFLPTITSTGVFRNNSGTIDCNGRSRGDGVGGAIGRGCNVHGLVR